MNPIYFICPRSHQLLDPGFALDLSAFRQTRTVTVALSCSRCRGVHEMKVGEGLFCDSPPPSYRAAA
jgi:hypothetical protein